MRHTGHFSAQTESQKSNEVQITLEKKNIDALSIGAEKRRKVERPVRLQVLDLA